MRALLLTLILVTSNIYAAKPDPECPDGQIYDKIKKECVDDPNNDGGITPVPSPEDIDGDGILNEDDPDIDGDGLPNETDSDADGDGLEDSSGLPQITEGRFGWQEIYKK